MLFKGILNWVYSRNMSAVMLGSISEISPMVSKMEGLSVSNSIYHVLDPLTQDKVCKIGIVFITYCYGYIGIMSMLALLSRKSIILMVKLSI